MPIPHSLIHLHHGIKTCFDRNLGLTLATKASHLPGITHFTRATVMPLETPSSRPYYRIKFATEEQVARAVTQTVNVMHRSAHIDSYEIFTEERGFGVGEEKEEEERSSGS